MFYLNAGYNTIKNVNRSAPNSLFHKRQKRERKFKVAC